MVLAIIPLVITMVGKHLLKTTQKILKNVQQFWRVICQVLCRFLDLLMAGLLPNKPGFCKLKATAL